MKVTTIPWHRNVSLLMTCPEIGLYAINKPINILSHPNSSGSSSSSIVQAPYDMKSEAYLLTGGQDKKTQLHSRLYLLHRLDKSTSGVLLCADHANVAKYIKGLFKSRQVRKQYQAIVYSPFEIKNATQSWIDQYEFKKGFGQQTAKTDMMVLSYNPKLRLARLLLEPKTGFTHQLRIQCAIHGLPILGDDIHGDFATNKFYFQNGLRSQSNMADKNPSIPSFTKKNRLYLHSQSIKFPFEYLGIKKSVECVAPIPAEFDIS